MSDRPAAEPGNKPEMTDKEQGSVFALFAAFKNVVNEFRFLLIAETRLFLFSVVLLLALIILCGLLAALACFCLLLLAGMLLVRYAGMDPILALLCMMALLALLSGGVLLWIRKLLLNLKFRHSRAAVSSLFFREQASMIPADGGVQNAAAPCDK